MFTQAQRLKNHVTAIATPVGRMVGSEGHRKARDYLCDALADAGCVPYSGGDFILPYEREGIQFYNLVGVVPGTNRRKKPILIGPHYDSVIEAPCADDNAAAVAIGLEMARKLASNPPERDTILALFDAEEPPYFLSECMGSHRFFHDQMQDNGVHAAMVMDLVGHDLQIPASSVPALSRFNFLQDRGIPIPHFRKLLFVTGVESHPAFAPVLERTKRVANLPTIFAPTKHVGDMGDYAVFREEGVPYLFFSCGRWQHYHEPTDTPNRLNYRKMARITRYATRLLRNISNTPLPPAEENEEATVDLEILSLKRSLGPLLPMACKKMGMTQLCTRDNLDEFAENLMSLGL